MTMGFLTTIGSLVCVGIVIILIKGRYDEY